MKKLNKALLGSVAAVMALALCVVLAACGGSSTSSASSSSSASGTTGTTDAATGYTLIESGKLTVGSDLDYKPMEYLDEQGNATGFAYDMMSEICSRIGLELNYLSPQNFDTLITQVAGGTNMDVAVSSITINDEREELVDFSTPYYDSNQAVVVKADATYTSIDELNGKTVNAQQGTTGEEWIKENLRTPSTSRTLRSLTPYAALKSGKVEDRHLRPPPWPPPTSRRTPRPTSCLTPSPRASSTALPSTRATPP